MDTIEQRPIKFKDGIKQKTSSMLSKLGRMKNAFIERIKSTKDKVVDLATTKMANHYLKKEEKELQRKEAAIIKEEELAHEREIEARTEEHKIGMKEALKEQTKLERQERLINFKQGVKQKTSSVVAKLGTMKNGFIEKVRLTNLDVKIRNLLENAQISGLNAINEGKEFVTTQVANYYLKKEEKELERAELERIKEEELAHEREIEARTEEHKIGMKEALKEQDRLERQQRIINFKESIKQRTNSLYARLGTMKISFVEKIRLSNIDVKIRNILEEAQIAGLSALNSGKEYVATQVANYYLDKAEKEIELAELEKIKEEKLALEREIEARTKEHKIGMKEALKNQSRLQRQQRIMNFKQGVKQKTSTVFGKLGRMKNAFIEKLKNAKDKIVDFGSTQMANYYLKKEEKDKVKAFKEAAALAEKQELLNEKARIKERKSAMKEALNAQEREMYEQKHLENQTRKEELIASVFGDRELYEVNEAVRAL